MSRALSAIWTTESTESIKTGSWRTALPAYVGPPAPCHNACPVNGDIAVWIRHLRKRDYYDAWLALVDNNPFPAIAGRVCHRPCESSCNRSGMDEPVAIRCLERFLGDMALEQGWTVPVAPLSKAETVAIVGGGPAGLSAAFHLRRMGYAVALFEARPQLGGVLRYGIPAYRLARDVLDAEIARMLKLGIDVRTNSRIDTPADVDRLQREYAAVYIATGAGVPKRLPQLDYTRPWVIDGTRYLEQSNGGNHPDIGARVVVIGGGSAAMDVARSARRHGREVTVLALEDDTTMPAQEDEVRQAREEGVSLIGGAMLRSVAGQARQGLQLDCIRVDFEAGDTPGQFRVTELPGTDFLIDADAIVTATGQDPETDALRELLEVDAALVRIDERQETSRGGIFAGGDLVTLARFVTVALGCGKRAAAGIDGRLQSKRPAREPEPLPAVAFEAINTRYHAPADRLAQPLVPAAARQVCFGEVAGGIGAGEAAAESARCFSCGQCTFCDNCFYFCPDMAISRATDGYAVDADYCKGCGLCVAECPTGSIVMRTEAR